MEHNKNEVQIIEKAMVEAEEKQRLELNDLHLALVGGGMGETTL